MLYCEDLYSANILLESEDDDWCVLYLLQELNKCVTRKLEYQ